MTARRLQCFEGAGIEEKSHCPDEDYSIFVAPGFFVEIAGDNHFAEIVADVAKGESFLSSFLLVRNHVGGLYVYALVGLVDDKINLVLPDLVFAGGSGFERDDANINRVSSPDKFVVDDILHEMRRFILPEVDAGVAESGVDGVVFARRFKITPPLYVKPPGFCDKEGVFEKAKVRINGFVASGHLGDRFHRICDLVRVRESADSTHDHIKEYFNSFRILDFVSLHDISEVDCPVEFLKVVLFLGIGLEQHALWKPSEGQIFVEYGLRLVSLAERHELRKRKRSHLNGVAATPKDCGDVGNEELGIGASYIGIDTSHGPQFAKNAVERNVGAFAVVGVDAVEVDAGRKNLLAVLDLVDEHVIPASVLFYLFLYIREKVKRIVQRIEVGVFKIDFYDVVFPDATFDKMVLEEFEKKITLAASPDSGDYLDEFVVLCVSQAPEQSISLNGHVVSSIPKLLDLSKFLEVCELYHAPSRKARATLTSVPFSTLRNARIRRHGISTTRKRLALKCIHRAAGIVEKRRDVD